MKNTALFNIDPALWKNYGEFMAQKSPSLYVSLSIHADGDLSNGIQHLARFASRKDAVHVLKIAGWVVSGDAARFFAR